MGRYNFIFLFLITLLAFNVKASRGRISALQSIHLSDPELIYYFPSKQIEIPNYLIFQTGATESTYYNERPYAAFKSDFLSDNSDFYSVGFTMGRSSDLIDGIRDKVNRFYLTQYEQTANPVDFNYTFKSLGNTYSVGFFYADKNEKVNLVGNHAATLNFGLRIDDFTFSTNAGLYNSVVDPTTLDRLSIYQSFVGRLLYELDDIDILLDISSSQIKLFSSGVETSHLELLNYKMGLVKNEINGQDKFFYRLDLVTEQGRERTLNLDTRTISLPLTVGIESMLNDLFTIRGSVKQIIGVYKSSEFDPGENTTTAAVGVGLNIHKINIDGTFKGLIGSSANQQVNSNQLMTETSLTYWF